MSGLVLTLRAPLPRRLDASLLSPQRLAARSVAEIERLVLRFEDGESVALGELFEVSESETLAQVLQESKRDGQTRANHSLRGNSRGHQARGLVLRLVGNLATADGVGRGMREGVLQIEGDVGRQLGLRMTGGCVEVAGNAGDGVGTEMAGGQIVVRGSVGRGTGSARPGGKRGMSGGEIIVFGDAGAKTGACLRRGVIAVSGSVGPDALASAIAGTLLAVGDVAAPAGRWSKRASLIALGAVSLSPTYRYACTYQPTFIAVLLTYLQRMYQFRVTTEQVTGFYRRYCGDFAESGRGEILQWVGA